MVAVVPAFHLSIALVLGHTVDLGQCSNVLIKVDADLLFGHTASSDVAIIHGNVINIIQVAKDADFRELCHSSKETHLNVSVGALHHTIKGLQLNAELVL